MNDIWLKWKLFRVKDQIICSNEILFSDNEQQKV